MTEGQQDTRKGQQQRTGVTISNVLLLAVFGQKLVALLAIA